MKKNNNEATGKPRFKYFYDFINDAIAALDNVDVISIPDIGVHALFKELRKRKLKLIYGSLRLDRDSLGKVFLKEYRPRRFLPFTGYFYNVKPVFPFWESIGSALIRLSEKKKRQNDLKNKQNIIQKIWQLTTGNGKDYCFILQGNMEKEYVKVLLEQGRITYNTQESHMKEEPIFSALSILSQLTREQIVETDFKNKQDIEKELYDTLKIYDKSIQEIGCIVGKKDEGEFYCALNENKTHLDFTTLGNKLLPFELAKEIVLASRSLINGHRLLILDNMTFDNLLNFLGNFDKYYLKLS